MKKIAIVLFVVAAALAGCSKKNASTTPSSGGTMGSDMGSGGAMGSGAATGSDMGSGGAMGGSGGM